jgi:hypothetical protein
MVELCNVEEVSVYFVYAHFILTDTGSDVP